jgi:hypothetical protein
MMPKNRRQPMFSQSTHCLPALFVVICVCLLAGTAAAYDSAECIACHGQKEGASKLTMDLAAFEASVHNGQAECGDCHSQVVDESHTRTIGAGAADCSGCHDTVNAHGTSGPAEARPDCAACHSRHGILAAADPGSTVNPANLATTCGRCHEAQTGRPDYLSFLPSVQISSHPKQDFGGSYSRADCIGCHQGQAVHGEKKIIADTGQCYRCHIKPDGKSALMGVMHARADLARQPGTWVAGVIYQLFMLALLGFGGAYAIGRISRRSRS